MHALTFHFSIIWESSLKCLAAAAKIYLPFLVLLYWFWNRYKMKHYFSRSVGTVGMIGLSILDVFMLLISVLFSDIFSDNSSLTSYTATFLLAYGFLLYFSNFILVKDKERFVDSIKNWKMHSRIVVIVFRYILFLILVFISFVLFICYLGVMDIHGTDGRDTLSQKIYDIVHR